MIVTRGLAYSYNGVHQLEYPDIDVAPGNTLLITGQSGCGKSTLLHLLAGLLTPASGNVFFSGVSLSALTQDEASIFRKKHIGIVFQRTHFVKALSIKDNLLLATHGKNVKEVYRLLENLGLKHLAHRLPATLSQGEQQRAAVARAVINRPVLLLADEPTSNLDDDHAVQVIQLLQQQAAAVEAALIIVTHDSRLKQVVPQCIHLS